jgi:MFS transporter, DHA2 family, multidrug resistance protein
MKEAKVDGPAAEAVSGKAADTVGSTAPKRAGVVLATLIVVAGVANLNLAVANVALPDIGKALDASQTGLNLVSIGFSLGLAMSVLYLGALGDRHGRKEMLVLGMALSIPASLVAGLAGSVEVLFIGRLLGGVAAGMAYPTTLALITALWADGPRRTQAIALWSGLGGAVMALGPLVAGALLEHFSWGWVFLVTMPFAALGLLLALRFIPPHVGETTEPVDNLGGVLSVVLVGALVLGINFAAVPGATSAAVGLGVLALAAGIAFVLRQRRAHNPIYDLNIARRKVFWVAALAGVIVFGTLMATMYIGQQFIQNILGYSTFQAGAAILPAALMMVVAAAPSGKLVTARGSRVTLLLGFASCLLGFLVMLVLWGKGTPYWQVGLAYALVGLGVGLAMTPASRCLTGAVPVRRAGMASGTADLQRDLGGAIMTSIMGAVLTAGYSAAIAKQVSASPQQAQVTSQTESALQKSYSSAAALATHYPHYQQQIIAAARTSFLDGANWAYTAGIIVALLGAALVFFKFPTKDDETTLLTEYHADDARTPDPRAEPASPGRVKPVPG